MSIRRKALEALSQIIDGGAYANLCLKKAEEGLGERDAKWISAAVYSALDNLMMIDLIIACHAKGKLDKTIRNILRLGVCQARYMLVPESAACNESVKLAKEVGKGALSGYVNGVMRSICRSKDAIELPHDPVERLSIEHSWPKWLVEELCQNYGIEEAEAIISSKEHGFYIRAQWPYSDKELEGELTKRSIGFRRGGIDDNAFYLESGFDVTKEPLFAEGKLTVQSESAMLICRIMEPKADMKILDACCAPGGKTAYMASLAKNMCDITGFDLHEHRKELTEKTLSRLNVTRAKLYTKNSAEYDAGFEKAFDAVLTDVPCSGLGVRGKPDVRYAKTPAIIDELCRIQSGILDTCSRYVKPGGTLVYSTCTVSKKENEDVANAFLRTHAGFEPCDISAFLPESMRDRASGGMIQLLPNRDNTEGFFIAKFIRRR